MKARRVAIVLAFGGAAVLAGSASARTPALPGADPPLGATLAIASAPPPQDPDTACMPPAALPAGADSLHVEIRNRKGLYPGDSTVTVTGMDGKPVASVACDGPWANFRLAPGRYRVSAYVGDRETDDIALDVPPRGARAVVTFPPEPWRDDEVL